MTSDPQTAAGRVDVTFADRVAWLTLVNPPDNRLTAVMFEQMNAALGRPEMGETDVLVITGDGRVFSKGIDLRLLDTQRDSDHLRREIRLANAVLDRLAAVPMLTVAAINGACLGGGLEVALACRMRVCAAGSRLGLPEVWLNLVPGLGGLYRLARLVGSAKALELVALGDLLQAGDAERMGVVSRVYPAEAFADGVTSFVRALAQADRRVVRHLLRLADGADAGSAADNIRAAEESFVELRDAFRG